MEFKGTPPADILERSKKRSKFFTDENEPIIRPNKKGRIRVPGCKNMREVIACDDDDFVDFVEVTRRVPFPLIRACVALRGVSSGILISECVR